MRYAALAITTAVLWMVYGSGTYRFAWASEAFGQLQGEKQGMQVQSFQTVAIGRPARVGSGQSPSVRRPSPEVGDTFTPRVRFANNTPSAQVQSPLPGVTSTPQRIVLPQWQFQPGQHNAITDVPGVKVGHVTIRRDIPHTVRTGVTAIIPHAGNLATEAVWANGGWLNGNGELTGLGYLQETGLLTSPIMLTNTYSLGKVHDGVFEYFQRTAPGRWVGLLPVVGECYDGFFNTITDRSAISTDDVVRSIETAAAGPVLQGRVGAGTGMRSFELHAGIGSASRKIEVDGKPYHIGVLVNANHTNNKGLTHLDPVIRQKLEAQLGPLTQIKAEDATHKAVQPPVAPPRQGSIIVIIATDLPLGPHQLKELVNRAALGLGAMGSTMDTTSGDGVIAFSTAQRIPLEADGPNPSSLIPTTVMLHDALSPVYRATVEAVTEAQINALIASHSGSKGN